MAYLHCSKTSPIGMSVARFMAGPGKAQGFQACLGKHGDDNAMGTHVIQDWTDSQVLLKFGEHKDVRYKIYKNGTRQFQEIRDVDDAPIHTLELPEGLALEKSSYEVLLRYVLMDIMRD